MADREREPDSPPPTEPGNEDFDLGEMRGSRLVFFGSIFEASLILVALALGYFGFHDPNQSLARISWIESVRPAVFYGVPATAFMLLIWVIASRWRTWPIHSMTEIIERVLIPAFAGITVAEAALISLLAGCGEELLFRWSLQGGITELVTSAAGNSVHSWWGIGVGLLVSSALFGICHWLSLSYALATFAIGLFLGGLMIWTGTWLAPAIAHALYDFVILLWLSRRVPKVPKAL